MTSRISDTPLKTRPETPLPPDADINPGRAPFKALEWLALAAVFSFALVFWLDQSLARTCEVAAWIALLLSAGQIYRHDRGEWLWLVMIFWLIFMLAVNYAAILKNPELKGEHLHFTRYYFRLFLFLVAGWWLKNRPKAVFLLLALAALGLFAEAIYNGGLSEWQRLLAGRRVDFAFRNAQHTALLFSTVLIGALCFWKRFFKIRPRWLRPAGIFLWLALTVLSFLIVTGAQSRQVYPAFFACLCVAALWAVYELHTGSRITWSKIALYTGSAGLILVLLITVFNPFQGVQNRFEKEWGTIVTVLKGDLNDLPRNNVSIRIRQWRFAAGKFLEAPLAGHGGATKYALIEQSDLSEYIKRHFGHFHNGYLEMAVAYGIPGLVMLPLLITVLAGRLLRAWRAGRVPADFMLFGILSLVFFAVVNLFESYPMYRSGHFFMFTAGGAIYALTKPPAQKVSNGKI